MTKLSRSLLTSAHWGTYEVKVSNGRVTSLNAFSEDKDSSPIGPGIVDVMDGPSRIMAPMVRERVGLKMALGQILQKEGQTNLFKSLGIKLVT